MHINRFNFEKYSLIILALIVASASFFILAMNRIDYKIFQLSSKNHTYAFSSYELAPGVPTSQNVDELLAVVAWPSLTPTMDSTWHSLAPNNSTDILTILMRQNSSEDNPAEKFRTYMKFHRNDGTLSDRFNLNFIKADSIASMDVYTHVESGYISVFIYCDPDTSGDRGTCQMMFSNDEIFMNVGMPKAILPEWKIVEQSVIDWLHKHQI